MCAGITTFNSIRNQGLKGGDLVAVQGVGGLGHLAIQFANRLGFKVVALSTGKDKEKLAKELGAHVYVDTSSSDAVAEIKKLGGAKLIVCTAPHAKAIEPLVNALDVGGKLLILAAVMEPLQVNTLSLLSNKNSIVGWPSGDSRDSEDTLNFAHLSGVKPMIETFPLEKANEAFKHMMDNKVKFRCVLVMNQ
jgi:propanol-preferring alcohol dehydrogenase